VQRKFKVADIVDLATLTGACRAALGEKCAGLFTNNQTLSDVLMNASSVVGEPIWPLPIRPVLALHSLPLSTHNTWDCCSDSRMPRKMSAGA
jgi:leucyl aminopeptidase